MEIAVLNRSTDITDKRAAKIVAAVNRQVQRDFLPYWGGAFKDVWVEFDMRPEKVDWTIIIEDEPDIDGAAGYHTLEGDEPFGKVFTRTPFETSTVLSHEVLEIIADPAVNRWAYNWDDGQWYAIEVCDPVQNTEYWIDDVLVSDFVLPAWFGMNASERTAFDNDNRDLPPWTIAPGGYVIKRGTKGTQFIGEPLHKSDDLRLSFRGLDQ